MFFSQLFSKKMVKSQYTYLVHSKIVIVSKQKQQLLYDVHDTQFTAVINGKLFYRTIAYRWVRCTLYLTPYPTPYTAAVGVVNTNSINSRAGSVLALCWYSLLFGKLLASKKEDPRGPSPVLLGDVRSASVQSAWHDVLLLYTRYDTTAARRSQTFLVSFYLGGCRTPSRPSLSR